MAVQGAADQGAADPRMDARGVADPRAPAPAAAPGRAGTDRSPGAARRTGGDWRIVLPVLNEAAALPALLGELATTPDLLRRAVFVDNGSSDGSAALITAAGGTVVFEAGCGYGLACLAGVAAAATQMEAATGRGGEAATGRGGDAVTGSGGVRVVVFMEADGSDDPSDLPRLVAPVLAGNIDLLVGSRRRAVAAGAPMAPHQRLGNLAAVAGMRLLFGIDLPDNGPFRAVRADLLDELQMEPRGYAWTTRRWW
ncbi:MAG: glycosyltransferase family 2 protein [Actinobacteria bacterium]|nr:glycosyltransferase family 2 protein [Actinomycetota bacterium]